MIHRQSGGTVDREFLSFLFVVRDRGGQAAIFPEYLKTIIPAVRNDQMTAVMNQPARLGETTEGVLFLYLDARMHLVLPDVSPSAFLSTQFPVVAHFLLAHLPVVSVVPCRSGTLTRRDIQAAVGVETEIGVVE